MVTMLRPWRRSESPTALGDAPVAAPSRPPPRRNFLEDTLRSLVSKKKRRFREDGYDLDLTYVTPRLVAMGFPAAEREAMYRNDRAELERLLEERHGRGRYRLYNLCAERSYGPDRFGGAFCRFPFQDHAPPPLGMFFFFCADVDDFLQADAAAVAAVHCKAGKGRTGVMLSAYLLWSGQWDDADDAMRFYGFARTENVKGVTIPSQRRFVRYFRTLLDRGAERGARAAARRRLRRRRRLGDGRRRGRAAAGAPREPHGDIDRALTCSLDGTFALWKIDVQHKFNEDAVKLFQSDSVGHGLHCIAVSPNGKAVAVAGGSRCRH